MACCRHYELIGGNEQIFAVDPTVTATLPANVVAASGFDVLSHALESYIAAPYTRRKAPETPAARPMSQGANPWSDVGCVEALKRTGALLVRAVKDREDQGARHGMMYAATLAGDSDDDWEQARTLYPQASKRPMSGNTLMASNSWGSHRHCSRVRRLRR